MSLLSLASCMVIFSITDNLRKSMLLKVNRFLNQESYLISFCIFKCILKNVNCLGKKYLQKKISVKKKGKKLKSENIFIPSHSDAFGWSITKFIRERETRNMLSSSNSQCSQFFEQRHKDSRIHECDVGRRYVNRRISSSICAWHDLNNWWKLNETWRNATTHWVGNAMKCDAGAKQFRQLVMAGCGLLVGVWMGWHCWRCIS